MKPQTTVAVLTALGLALCAAQTEPACIKCALEAPSPDLFNGQDLTGWSPLIEKAAPGTDPGKHIVVRDGAIHMYADTPVTEKVPFGNIVTDRSFSRFKLTFEYSWGGKKFAPRADKIRDAGLLYHIADTQKLWGAWPHSMEMQIQEGDVGDLVFIKTGALTWMNPDPQSAPEGQGDPGMLPEIGGYPRSCSFGSGFYIGRYPVADRLEGWNTVEAVVQADEWAYHKVNGILRSRLSDLVDDNGKPLREGRLALQMEGAEIRYRKIRVEELPAPLKVSARHLSLSAVQALSFGGGTVGGRGAVPMPWNGGELELPGRMAIEEKRPLMATLTVTNTGTTHLPCKAQVVGRQDWAFGVMPQQSGDLLAPGENRSLSVYFSPSGPSGVRVAGLQIGSEETGAFVILRGLVLEAFEGNNEPGLQGMATTLGIPDDVGGPGLHLDTTSPKLGSSLLLGTLIKVGEGVVRMTPVARFSPPGENPFGWFEVEKGYENVIGTLADSSKIKDAHQRLIPPLAGGPPTQPGQPLALTFDPGSAPFGLFLRIGGDTISMDTDRHPPKVPYPVRVFPVSHFQGKAMKDALLVCFEEAMNGDYQDAVFLLENVRVQP